MTQDTDRDPLTRALGDLPRQRTSSSFTGEVLNQLATRSRPSSRATPRLLWAAAISVILAFVLVLGYGYQKQRVAERAYRQQVEELRSRYRDLLDEVATVRVQVESPPDTRLYLGGDEQLDLILDLSQPPAYADGRRQAVDARPAALEH